MHILHIPESINEPVPVFGGRSLEAGQEYLCSNALTGMLLKSKWRVVIKDEMWKLNHLLEAIPYQEKEFRLDRDWNDEDIWFYRGGGYGDLLMMTPLIRQLKKVWPTCRIHVAYSSGYHGIFHGLDVIEEKIPIPWDQVMLEQVIAFEETVEGTPAGEKVHIAQLFANHCNIILDDLRPEYQITRSESDWANGNYPRSIKPRIAVQFLASALYRSYPHIQEVVMELAKEAEVFLFGMPGQMELREPTPNITNLMETNLNFRGSAAVLATCDVCVAPDSSLVHLCSALDIPCVALFGPFPASLRTSSPKTKVFQGKAACAPCFFHAETACEFPAGMPCTEKGRCVAMESIPAQEVIEAAMELTHRIIT